MELGRVTDDVVEVTAGFLCIKELLVLGATSRRMRTLTTLDRVWAPRVATELSFGSRLDASTVASLTSLGCDPRRLCLQFLPWQQAWPPKKVENHDWVGATEIFAWRLRDVPASLCLDAAQEWVFCEVYERNEYGLYKAFASKVVRLTDCGPGPLGYEVCVPLELDMHNNHEVWYEVRVFALVGGVMVPICDTDAMDGESGERRFCLNSSPLVSDRADVHEMKLQLEVELETTLDEHDNSCRLDNLIIALGEYDDKGEPVDSRRILPGVYGLRRFLCHDAVRAQRTAFFVTDHLRSCPGYVDGNWKRPPPIYSIHPGHGTGLSVGPSAQGVVGSRPWNEEWDAESSSESDGPGGWSPLPLTPPLEW